MPRPVRGSVTSVPALSPAPRLCTDMENEAWGTVATQAAGSGVCLPRWGSCCPLLSASLPHPRAWSGPGRGRGHAGRGVRSPAVTLGLAVGWGVGGAVGDSTAWVLVEPDPALAQREKRREQAVGTRAAVTGRPGARLTATSPTGVAGRLSRQPAALCAR